VKAALYDQAQSNPLLRKLGSIAVLSDDEREAVLGLPVNIKEFEADADVIRDEDRPSDCSLVLSGFVCRGKAP